MNFSVTIQVRRFRESRQKNTNEEDDEVREVIFLLIPLHICQLVKSE